MKAQTEGASSSESKLELVLVAIQQIWQGLRMPAYKLQLDVHTMS